MFILYHLIFKVELFSMYNKGNISTTRISRPDLMSVNPGSLTRNNVSEKNVYSHVAEQDNALQYAKENVEDVIFTTKRQHDGVFATKVVYLNASSDGNEANKLLSTTLSSLKVGDVVYLEILYNSQFEGDGLMRANVAGIDDDGKTLIRTSFGVFSTDVDLGVDIGLDLLLKVHSHSVEQRAPNVTKNDHVLVQAFFKQLNNDISALQEVFKLMSNSEDERYRKLAYKMVTRSNKKIVDNVLRNSRVVDPAIVEKWIDDEIIGPVVSSQEYNPVKVLEDVVEKMKGIILDEGVDDVWRTVLIPVSVDQEKQMHKMFVRGKSLPGHFIRFVTELEVHEAKIQIDGLVHFTSHGSNMTHVDHLTITLRSKSKLPPQFTSDISKIFLAHQHISGIKGIIQFEEQVEFPINPESEIQGVEIVSDSNKHTLAKYI